MRLLTVLECLFLVALGWPLARYLIDPRLWRTSPRMGPWIGATVALGLVAVISVAVVAPLLLHALTVVGAILFLLGVLVTRPRYGVRRGMPPGRFQIVPLRQLLDVEYFLKQSRRYGAIFKTTQFGYGSSPNPFRGFVRPVVCVVGLKTAFELFREHDARLGTRPAPFNRYIGRGLIRYLPHDVHGRYRKLFRRALDADVVERNEPFLREHIRRALADFAMDEPRHPSIWASGMVLDALLRLFFGIDPATAEGDTLRRDFDRTGPRQVDDTVVLPTLERLDAWIRRRGRELAKEEGPASCFLGALLREDPTALDDPTVARNLIYTLRLAGVEDLAPLLVWELYFLAREPRWQERLRDEVPDSGFPLGERVALEALRLERMEYVNRVVIETFEFAGHVFPERWMVRVCVRESHLDPDVFEHPRRFDPDRYLGRNLGAEEFAPLGLYRVRCLGDPLIRAFSRVLCSEVAKGYDLELVRDGPREFRDWHWSPSSEMRLGLHRRKVEVRPSA